MRGGGCGRCSRRKGRNELREVEELVDWGWVEDGGGGVGGDAHNLLNDTACASSRNSRR